MITTFYSYKGGVGRTQLVANLAAYLCYYEYKKVLLIDWDLEAPGLHYYFGKTHQDIQKEGLIEVFQQYVNFRREGKIADENNKLPIFTKENNIINLDKSANELLGGQIDLIPAGKYADIESYKWKTIDFNWYEFYELLDGKRYIELIKTELYNLGYDYIFIDSRTGLTDYSDICNIQMPKVNVLVIAPTEQNLEGALIMANNIINSPYVKSGNYREGIVLPLLSRVEVDSNDFPPFFEKFQNTFSFLMDNINKLYPKSKNMRLNYFNETLLSYNRFIAIGEKVLYHKANGSKSLLGMAKQYENILKYLNLKLTWSGNTKELYDANKNILNIENIERQVLLWLDFNSKEQFIYNINERVQRLLNNTENKGKFDLITYLGQPSFINNINQQKMFIVHIFYAIKDNLAELLDIIRYPINVLIIYSLKGVNTSESVDYLLQVLSNKPIWKDLYFFENFYNLVLSGEKIEKSFEMAKNMQIIAFGNAASARYNLLVNNKINLDENQ
jgi:cellulose biosynthesis protein BcsQ